jgi:hypothetical protein
MKKYDAYASGPDERSTYAQCWGSTATSRGDPVAQRVSLRAACDAAISDGRAVDIYQHLSYGLSHIGTYYGGAPDRCMSAYLRRRQ